MGGAGPWKGQERSWQGAGTRVLVPELSLWGKRPLRTRRLSFGLRLMSYSPEEG